MSKKIEHTTIRNQKLFCLNCGGEYALQFPLPIEGVGSMSSKIEGFNLLHADCKPTWKEPEANLEETVNQRALWWIANGEVGNSSKTIWNRFMSGDNKPYPVNHPYDPDDFSRCYKLLKAIPEWRQQLDRMKPLSSAWSNLVDNWDKLTDMYEQNEKTNWKNYKQVGMYEFMQTLIN